MAKRKFEITETEDRALQKAYGSTKDGATRTRYQAVRLYGLGYAVTEIMQITGCSRTSLMDWCRIYRQQGVAGLVDQRRGGNHAKLSRAQKDELSLKLNLYTPRDLWGSDTHSSSGQFWTVEDLARGVAQWYGIHYQSRMAYLLLLKYCGFTYQRTEKVYKSRRTADVLAFADALEKK